ncbi:FAD-binding oxidoreductase [Paralcaligenes sp. KSB-10]|uniref:NAD(P)/FAD-dependent oxidoreductase n=1 Tax=Paralcaligenes sp. KSB-10 TaxID=2901142 RepID=UPI001E5FBB3E|nr:FAD-binding oxidoreductase [Paralcaligenes sp. KSB-10]UHL64161.1 FAD-binding oxidoreductase [Paralcaligenes sp. KSB-10]
MPREQFDVIIAGGAAVGSACAYFLTAHPDFKGSVLVVEKDFSYRRCATSLSAASIRHQFSTPENIRMSQFGTEFLRHFGQRLAVDGVRPEAGFHEGGYLFLATAAGLDALNENHRTQRALGVDAALLNPEQLAARFPWMRTDGLAAGSLGLSGEGWLDAYGMMQGFRKKAISQGAHYRENEVVQVQRKGRRITGVGLDNGEALRCGVLINAAGTGGPQLGRLAGIDLPVEARKRCIFYFQCPNPVAPCPLVIDPSGAYFRPEGAGFIGGIAPADDPQCIDFEVQYELFEEVLWPLLAARVPAFEAIRCTHGWAGHYDMNTLDHNLIIGAHPDIENLLFANGFSGHGLQQAPAVGRALSELVLFNGFRTLDLTRMGWSRILDNTPIIEKNVV